MKAVCMNCNHEQELEVTFEDSSGLYTVCEACTGSYDVNVRRLSLIDWAGIFRDLTESEFGPDREGEAAYVEVVWLDSTDEWVLCFESELFEDGYATEQEAQARLARLERELL